MSATTSRVSSRLSSGPGGKEPATDPRASDVAEAGRLLDRAAADEVVRLPVLSAAELWSLCGDGQVLADEDEHRWWAGQSPDQRTRLTADMSDLLADRGLLRRAGSGPWPMTPELGLVLAGRQRPAVVAVAVGPAGGTRDTPRIFGLSDRGEPPRVAVSEVVAENRGPGPGAGLGSLHHFSLLSAGRAGRVLASWATRGWVSRLRRGGPGGQIDLYRPGRGDASGPDCLTIGGERGGRHLVSRQRPGAAPESLGNLSREDLARQLTLLLTEVPW